MSCKINKDNHMLILKINIFCCCSRLHDNFQISAIQEAEYVRTSVLKIISLLFKKNTELFLYVHSDRG